MDTTTLIGLVGLAGLVAGGWASASRDRWWVTGGLLLGGAVSIGLALVLGWSASFQIAFTVGLAVGALLGAGFFVVVDLWEDRRQRRARATGKARAARAAGPASERVPPPAGSVFLSYRRSDGGFAARSIADVLRARPTGRQVFMDVDSIRIGADFHQAVQESIRASSVVLVLIGDRWLDPGPTGRSRLLDNDDVVRVEIESALRAGRKVLPVLIDDAPMPGAAQLPPSLRKLTQLNAARIRHASWETDAAALVEAVGALAHR